MLGRNARVVALGIAFAGAVVACGSQPAPMRPYVAPATSSSSAPPMAPPRPPPDLSEVTAPEGLVAVLTVPHTGAIEALLAEAGISDLVRDPKLAELAASDEPAHGVVVMNTEHTGKPAWAFAVPLRDLEAARALAAREGPLDELDNGAFRPRGATATDRQCVVSPAFGAAAPARLVCAEGARTLERATAFLVRTLPRRGPKPGVAHVEVRIAETMDGLEGALRLFGPTLQLRFHHGVTRRMRGDGPHLEQLSSLVLGELLALARDGERAEIVFERSGKDLTMRADVTLRKTTSRFTKALVAKGSGAPAAFAGLPSAGHVTGFWKASVSGLFADEKPLLADAIAEAAIGSSTNEEGSLVADIVRAAPFAAQPLAFAPLPSGLLVLGTDASERELAAWQASISKLVKKRSPKRFRTIEGKGRLLLVGPGIGGFAVQVVATKRARYLLLGRPRDTTGFDEAARALRENETAAGEAVPEGAEAFLFLRHDGRAWLTSTERGFTLHATAKVKDVVGELR